MSWRLYFTLLFVSLTSTNVWAEAVYYLNNLSGCEIRQYQDKNLRRVDDAPFINKVLNVKQIPKNPKFVAFKFAGLIYITRETCVMDAQSKNVSNNLDGREYDKKKHKSEADKLKSYKFFVEAETGLVNVSGKGAVADYNQAFPTQSSTNPTSWRAGNGSSYKATRLLSLGFGYRMAPDGFLAFKVRLINGKKSDEVTLTDLNTSISQSGVWAYEDSFKNFYGGYKFMFMENSAWKPIVAAYLGVSQMSSQLTDGVDSYQLSSFGLAALLEAGVEYHINSHFGLGGTFGFEYLGNRSMKFKEKTDGATDFKTKLSYNNTYFSFGIKYYF
jgi:hypothetical protein